MLRLHSPMEPTLHVRIPSTAVAFPGPRRKAAHAIPSRRFERPPRPPRLPAGTISRPRLLHRLPHDAGVPLVMVVAPAGYGKTTLLAD